MSLIRGLFNLFLMFLLIPLSTQLVSDIVRRPLPKRVLQAAEPRQAFETTMPARKKTGKKPASESPPAAVSAGGDYYRQLPSRGLFRFAWPDGQPSDTAPPVGPNGGWQDAFGNEWLPVLDARGRVVGWKQYLSEEGRRRNGLFRGKAVVYIAPGGVAWNTAPRFRDVF